MSVDDAAPTDEPNDRRPVTIYSDFVCPFCYLGRASLRQYRDDRDDRGLPPVEVDWQFFDLRGHKRGPDGEIRDDVDDGKDEDYYDQVRENVQRLREEYDADEMLAFDEVHDADSWDAQQAALYVKQSADSETFRSFYDAILEAHWEDGREIDDLDTLVELAESVGVDGGEIRDAVDDETLAEELESQFDAARERGVTGVPTFVADGHAARGAVPPSHLQRLLEAN
ncbi:DsbA family oxidoreductase [Halobaculum gomorrense]|uniref:Predicted dithiol-disulfide isomerase, DsbA family n=1 Tax=Halobaculum gomorrense TaxID=43928 RepID=A0A1M5KJ08_9EURY|nr:DsbA family protein [Halobaculum gomorrense]SHG52698.1 Predicted dithiol-disulfide isomerase, DsbA family [Halobaculum gomorrense]